MAYQPDSPTDEPRTPMGIDSDAVDSQRELFAGLRDLYMTGISNRMNEVMKVLTIVGTIFIPLSFITGLYGMNFEYIPELGLPLWLLRGMGPDADDGRRDALLLLSKRWL